MTERTLCTEFQPLYLEVDSVSGLWYMPSGIETSYQSLDSGDIWYTHDKLDMTGYAQQDLTTFFRNSFEQRASVSGVSWQANPADPTSFVIPSDMSVVEQIIVSSVPLDDSNIKAYAKFGSPGFNQYNNMILPAGNAWGTFNREHIIHGHYTYYGPNAQTADSYDGMGFANLAPLVSEYYSSLEPTAADCLYCYRILFLNKGAIYGSSAEGAYIYLFPAMRVLMPAISAKEPWLEYVMRQARSYELANQTVGHR